MQEPVTFVSDGLDLAGILHTPDGMARTERRPCFIVLHGFGTNKDGTTPTQAAEILEDLGYLVLRFDARGCGESGGEPAFILCQDQVRDTHAAVTFLNSVEGVDTSRIGVIGHSFGGAVAPYATATDERIAGCISVAGWGDGVAKFREQHPTPQQWQSFVAKLEQGRRHRQATGRPMMIPRFDIVPIPEHMRHLLASDSIMEFPAETAMSMMDFRANDVVGLISPRPYLILHPADDTVTPTSQALGLFANAKQPCDMHLVSGADHFMLAGGNGFVRRILEDWLDRHFPIRAARGASGIHGPTSNTDE